MTEPVRTLLRAVGRVSLWACCLGGAASFAAAPAPAEEPSTSVDSQMKSADELGVPLLAPFSGPSPGRVLPPPSSLAGLDVAEPGEKPDALEVGAQRLLSQAMVTTAGKRQQRLADVPLTVSWIPGEELEGTGQFTLCDAIQYFPGMECRRGAMRKAAVSARGLGSNFMSNRLLLLKDGRPLTDPWTGQFYADETTPITNIKQIEVIRGPGSALYGSNAFSGVINLIERQPSDLIAEGHSVGAEARVLAGKDNTYRVQTTAAGRTGGLEGLLHYYGYLSDGPGTIRGPNGETNEGSNVHEVSGKVKYKALSLDGDFTTATLGRPGGTHVSTVGNCGRCHFTPEDTEHVQNGSAALQVDTQVASWLRLFGQAYGFVKRRSVDLRDEISGQVQSVLGKRRRLGAEARALMTAGPVTVTVGGDAKHDLVNNENILPNLGLNDTQEAIFGAFIDAEFKPISRLVIAGGARYDHYDLPQRVWTARTDQISPRASVVFHATPQVSLRANYGRAFRAPTLSELAINQQMYASTLLGNPDLRAETLDTFEASIDAWPFDRTVRLTATGFWNNAKNFINPEFAGGSTSLFQNIGNARVRGVELEAAAQVPALNSSFDVAYQFMEGRSLAFEGRPEQQLEYAPKHRVYLRGRTRIATHGFIELFGLYVGERYDPGFAVDATTGAVTGRVRLPGYFTANARVGVDVTPNFTASLLATNLFNTSYQEMYGFPSAPIGAFAEIKLRY